MEIILNETEWTVNQINKREMCKDAYSMFRRIARYYLDKGYDKEETLARMERFLMAAKPEASPVRWNEMMERALAHAQKQPAIDTGSITVTAPEMETIKALKGKQLQRLAFALLCISKFWNLYSAKNDSWVRTPDNEIMRYANIKTSVMRQSLLYHSLIEAGLIRMPKKVDNTNVKVEFAQEGDAALVIEDFRNLGYQYLMYIGEPYFKCERCGVVTRLKNPNGGRPQKYCVSCAVQAKTEQSVNAVMRQRGGK